MAGTFGLDPSITFKKAFFDRQQVKKKLGKAMGKILRQAGAYTRTVARRSMRNKSMKGGEGLYGQKVSAAGKPPLALSRRLKDEIYFHADTKKRLLVVIGPTKNNSAAAEVLEHGGTISGYAPEKVEMRVDKKDGKRKLMPAMINGKQAMIIKQQLTYKPRPYMGPAINVMMDKMLPKWLADPSIPNSLKNQLKQ